MEHSICKMNSIHQTLTVILIIFHLKKSREREREITRKKGIHVPGII